MKKKGLIISTVVMVVVLIASLTTATYAWFTAASTVQVNDIALSVKSSAQVNVGVKHGTGSTYNDYYYNTISLPASKTGNANAVEWEGTDIGLGSTLTFEDLQLGGSKAVGTSSYAEGWNGTDKIVDATTNMLGDSKYVIVADGKKGEGANNNQVSYEEGSVALAEANRDYLNATIGIEANKENLKGLFAKVEVVTTDSKVTLGVNAAIHFIIKVGNKKINVEPFGNLANTAVKSNATLNTNVSNPVITRTGTGQSAQLTSTFYFWIAQKTTSEDAFLTGGKEIKDFQIYAYIDGTDPHCVLDAEGSCVIKISFDGTSDVTKLGNDASAAAVSSVCFLTLA